MMIPTVGIAVLMGVFPNIFLKPMEPSIVKTLDRINGTVRPLDRGRDHGSSRPSTGSQFANAPPPELGARPTIRVAAMNSFAATIPMLIVVLSAIAAMMAEAIRHPGERMYIAGFGLIGLVGAPVASCFLWNTDAVSFGVVRADNFSLFINIILCIIGIITMLFSHDVIEREDLPAGEYYALTLFGITGMMLMASATDLLVIFLALEVLSLSVYVLTGLRRDPARRRPRRRSSTSCSARSRARSSSTASRSRSLSRARRGSTSVGSAIASGRQQHAARSSRSACWRSASASRCPPCRSTCGRPTPTKGRPRS